MRKTSPVTIESFLSSLGLQFGAELVLLFVGGAIALVFTMFDIDWKWAAGVALVVVLGGVVAIDRQVGLYKCAGCGAEFEGTEGLSVVPGERSRQDEKKHLTQ